MQYMEQGGESAELQVVLNNKVRVAESSGARCRLGIGHR